MGVLSGDSRVLGKIASSSSRSAGALRASITTAWTSIVAALAIFSTPLSADFYKMEADAIQAMLDVCPLARATNYYFSQSGNDTTKDGRDPLGLALTGATFDSTTMTLTKVGGFAAYTFSADDKMNMIYLASGTVGAGSFTPGLYKISSKTSSDAVVLATSPLTGTTTATAITSSTGPFKTKAKASDMMVVAAPGSAFLFKCDDDWAGETRTWVYQQAAGAAIANGSSTFVISPYPAGCPEIGDTWVFSTVNAATGGTTQTTTISNVARVSGVSVTVTLAAAANQAGYIAGRWVGPANLDTGGRTDITVDSYGTGRIPQLTNWQRNNSSAVSLNAGNFTTPATRGDGFLNTYSIAETRTVVAFREKGSDRIWRRVNTVYEVDCIPGSWCQLASVIYGQDHEGVLIGTSGRQYEIAVSNNVPGIYVRAGSDGIRINNVDVSAMGARIALHAAFRSYGILCEAGAGKRIAITNVVAHYNDNHAIGATTGESMLVMRCDAGLCGNNDTPYVFYANYGGHEALVMDCVCRCTQAPANVRHGAGPGAILAHTGAWSTSTDVPTWAAGATSFTIPGGAIGAANLVLAAGDQIQAQNGANPNETMTVQSVDRSGGTVYLTAPTTYSSVGRTAVVYVSSDIRNGNTVVYAPKLFICGYFRTPPGPYQTMAMGGGGYGIPYVDPKDCRMFVHDCYAEMRTRSAEDTNVFPIRIADTGAAGATTTTLVDGMPSGVSSASIYNGARVRLSGGGSRPEWVTLTSIGGTGAGATVTLPALTGANRTVMELELGMASVPLAWSNLVNACVWNMRVINRLNWRANNVANSTFISSAGSTSDLITAWNWDVTFDARAIADPQFSRTRYVASANLKFPTLRYSRVRILASGRDNVAWDTTAATSTAKFFDCILIGQPGPDGGTVAAWTQNDSAHLARNLYVGWAATNFSADTDPLTAAYSHDAPITLDDASTLLKTAQAVYGTQSPEYDLQRNMRSTGVTARGPYAARSEPSGAYVGAAA